MTRFAVGVMAKAPIPGYAKTRLIPVLGAEGAAALQARLILKTLETARAATPDVTLFTAGDPDHPFWNQCPPVPRRPQQGEDLGARMAHALEHLLRRAPRALLIGSDCPALTPAHLSEAAAALAEAPQVFIPAADGGYVLVGTRALQPALFTGIDWGSEKVMAQTRERLRHSNLGWRELAALPDLDTPLDLEAALRAGWLPANGPLEATPPPSP